MREVDEVLHKLKPGETPGVDGLPAEVYGTLQLNTKRHITARLWDIAIGRKDIPQDWANLVHPLYKKGDRANLGSWRPIVCATTEAKLSRMLILNRGPQWCTGPSHPGSGEQYQDADRWKLSLCRTQWWIWTP